MREKRWLPGYSMLAVVVTALLMLALVELHINGVKGPAYGVLNFRRLPALRVYGLMLLASLPALAAVVIYPRIRRGKALLLALPMIGSFLLRLSSAAVTEQKLNYISDAVLHPNVNSYYIDAVALSSFPNWLAQLPEAMPMLSMHSRTKAPGSIMFYMAFIKLMGHSAHTALIAGLVIGALASLSIPACYLLLRALDADETTAFLGTLFMSLCPGFTLFFPMSDPVYPLLSCGVGICWIYALKRNSIAWSIATGAVTAAILVISFNVLVFGSFLVAYALIVPDQPLKDRSTRALRHAAIAAVACALLLLVVFKLTLYNPVETLRSAWENEHALRAQNADKIWWQRPYPNTVWNDLIDFALGSGWISDILAGATVAFCLRTGLADRRSRIVLLGIGQLVFVAITALLPSETARVWNFMLPLLMLPVGIEIARQGTMGRVVILACLAVILAAMCRNLSFIM